RTTGGPPNGAERSAFWTKYTTRSIWTDTTTTASIRPRYVSILHALRTDFGADLKYLQLGSMKAGNCCTQHSDQITLGDWLFQESCNHSFGQRRHGVT